MKRLALLAVVCALAATAAQRKAKNVVLFIGDAGGISTLNAASYYIHGEPQKLYIQNMPHIALVDTSAANAWVTDSAAGMSAIVTGQKTNSGVISQSATAVRGERDGERLKTILEYAEEHGMSTGVISNVNITDATPAACYAHANDRKKSADIFKQLLSPTSGDGVDVVIGGGRQSIFNAADAANFPLKEAMAKSSYAYYTDPTEIPADAKRVLTLTDGDYEAAPAVHRAIDILSKNPKGFFLMVEWDMHTDKLARGLENAKTMDALIAGVARRLGKDTLILYSADHSFDIRLRGGKPGAPLPLASADPNKPAVRVDNGHTGEEVLAAAQGPGSEKLRGFMRNTDLFRVMMSALGFAD